MRRAAVVCIVVAVEAFAGAAFAGKNLRLAQSSTTTNCMMACNSQAASCQTTCVVPAPPALGSTATGSSTVGPNPTASTSCTISCVNVQLACQTNCARNSPSP